MRRKVAETHSCASANRLAFASGGFIQPLLLAETWHAASLLETMKVYVRKQGIVELALT